MKTLNSLLEAMKGFEGPKHDQGTRKPGEIGPKKVYANNTVTSEKGGPSAASLGSQEFIDDHEIEKTPDANKNGDDVFKATNVKVVDRKKERHGRDAKDSEQVYERTLSMAELKKRKEIADAIKRDHPEYSDEKKMAIATAQAKKVAEEVTIDQVDDILEAVLAEQDEQEVEAITTMLEAVYESLEDDESREQFVTMLESDEDFEKLLSMVQGLLAESEEE
jgi:hypothetical protein